MAVSKLGLSWLVSWLEKKTDLLRTALLNAILVLPQLDSEHNSPALESVLPWKLPPSLMDSNEVERETLHTEKH